MDIRVGDIWIYDDRGESSYWLIYKKDRSAFYISKLGGNLDTSYRFNEFLAAKNYWTLALRVT